MTIGDRLEKKNKNIAFVSKDNNGEDNLSEEAIAFIGKKFNKSLNKLQNKMDDKLSNNNRNRDVPDKLSNIRS
jgi:carbonic anhydrase